MSEHAFMFPPRGKEELVVSGSGGSLLLELSMGRMCAYLPTKQVWANTAPAWARSFWSALHAQLQAWCIANNAGLCFETDCHGRRPQDLNA